MQEKIEMICFLFNFFKKYQIIVFSFNFFKKYQIRKVFKKIKWKTRKD